MMTSRASVPVPGSEQVFESGAHLPSLEVPGRGLVEQTGFYARLLRPELEAKHVPKEMVEAKPPAMSVQRNEEHRLPLELLEDELGVRLAGQGGDQVRAHRVQH